MSIDAIFASAAQSLITHVDTAATYTPIVGAAVSCHVCVMKNSVYAPEGMSAMTWEQHIVIDALVSEVGQPGKGSTFLVGAITYTVVEITGNDSFIVSMVVK
jgi:hypothetical protein